MLILVEDSKSDLKLLIKAFVEQGIRRDSIKDFLSMDEAQEFIDKLDKRSSAPIAIVADVGFGNQLRNGINFIVSQYEEFASNLGGGIWLFLISRGDLTRGLGVPQPLPHATFDKHGPDWERKCAKALSSLFIDSFPFDGDNDLAPPKELKIPVSDRLYLFSSGEACRLALQDDDQSEQYLAFGRPKHCYFDEVNPILMYRGHYIIPDHQKEPTVQPKLARVLLRWRRVALAKSYGDDVSTFPKKINARQIHTWTVNDGTRVLDVERGFHMRSVHNVVNQLRTNREVEHLCKYLFNADKKRLLPPFPNPKRWLPGRREQITFDYSALNQYLLPFPAFINRGELSDCFMTRLHFVLSDDEVENYEEWRDKWKEYFLTESSMKHAS